MSVADFFELDFLDVEADKSGDAIAIRYELSGHTYIHVVDGGFQDTGASVVKHIQAHYGNPRYIDHVVVTHADGDHTGGLRTVLETFPVGALWMLRPWIYAEELLPRFPTYASAERLAARLRQIYSNLVALENLAILNGVPIYEPFQGAWIGAFVVLAPTRARYLDLIVESDKTPESQEKSAGTLLFEALQKASATVSALVRAAWGDEVFSPQETSAENEMSVVQYATLCGSKILLTGDAGRSALKEAAAYAPFVGLALPGIDRFQVPHHGSRRNVSTELLDLWLGPRLQQRLGDGTRKFTAVVSSAKKDPHHPRKAVERALHHRGAAVYATEGTSICSYGGAVPARGWGPAATRPYPEDQEEE